MIYINIQIIMVQKSHGYIAYPDMNGNTYYDSPF